MAYNPDLDQIAVSVWTFSEFWIIDHGTTTAQAAGHTGGRRGKGGDLLYRWGNPRAYRAGTKADRKLFHQHNAHWIPKGLPGAGHLLLFNNGRERPDGSYSSVDELVLPADSQGRYTRPPGKAYGPDQPVWSYTAPKKPDFFSSFISGAQRLSNGNTLICSGANGTIFEVTPEKAIVWKYVNPVKDDTPPGTPPRPGQIMTSIAGEMLAISADQRKQLDEIQKDIDAHLDKLLTADQKKQAAEWPRDPGGNGYDPSPQPGQVMAGPEQNRLKLTDDQKKDVLALQKAIDGRFDRVLTAAQKNQIKTRLRPIRPSAGRSRSRRSSAARQDLLAGTTGHVEALRRAEETFGGDSEGDRREARDVAHGGPEKAAPDDAATPRRRRTGQRSPGRTSALPRPSLCNQLPRIRRQGPETGKNLGGIAAEGFERRTVSKLRPARRQPASPCLPECDRFLGPRYRYVQAPIFLLKPADAATPVGVATFAARHRLSTRRAGVGGFTVAVERWVHARGHPGDIAPVAEELVDDFGHLGRTFDEVLVIHAQDGDVRLLVEHLVETVEVSDEVLADQFPRRDGTAETLEHLLLRDQHLVEVALHEDDAVALGGGQVVEELRDHLERLAARLGQPRGVLP